MYRMLSIVTLLVVGVLLSASTASAGDKKQDKKKKKQAASSEIVGTIKSISSDGKTLTVEIPATGKKAKKLPPTTKEVRITDQTKIEFSGILPPEGKVLKPGNAVTVAVAETTVVPAASIKVTTEVEQPKKKKKKDKPSE